MNRRNWPKWVDLVFPYIEPLTAEQIEAKKKSLETDIKAIEAAAFVKNDERALDEAQRIAASEFDRVKSAETKATTYLAVLAALVPLVITLQSATWENKSGPAPIALKLAVLIVATIYVAAAGYHAFKTLKVAGFQRVAEGEIARAWEAPRPLRRLTISTLLASRRSRDTVNEKVTFIKVTHEHLIRAFAAFVILLLLDPAFYLMGFRNEVPKTATAQEKPQPSIPKVTKADEKKGATQDIGADEGPAEKPAIEGISHKEKPAFPVLPPGGTQSSDAGGEPQMRSEPDKAKPAQISGKAPCD